MTDLVSTLSLLALFSPLSLFLVWLLARTDQRATPSRIFRLGREAVLFSFVGSLVAGLAVWINGPLVSPVLGVGDLGISVRLDALSVVMFALVSSVGIFVIQFSYNYLDGDPKRERFLGGLALTIGAVTMLVLAGNLFHLVLAWIGTSLALHQLLLFYPERHGAQIAARKKFILARTGDVCLIAASVIFYQAFGSADLGELFLAAQNALAADAVPTAVSWATVMVVVAAALKSAAFPFHGWLLEVMETPTPVSALLHAGLLNGGTFLVVRMGDLMALFAPALHLLIIVGGFTALFASFAMITQNSVKVSLAYSSAAHMGFMLMLCGFGAHSVAIMHLVAHSYYKAHAFLSSGSIVDYVRELGPQKEVESPRPGLVLTALVIATGVFIGLGALLGLDLTKRPGETALGIIFVMATTQLLIRGWSGMPTTFVIFRTGLAALAVTVAFFALELSAAWILSGAVAVFPAPGPVTLAVMVLAVVSFGLISLAQAMLPSLVQTERGQRIYVHLKNGFYANALFDRWIGALR